MPPGDQAEQFLGGQQIPLAGGVQVLDGGAQLHPGTGNRRPLVEQTALQRLGRPFQHPVGHAGGGADFRRAQGVNGIDLVFKSGALHRGAHHGIDKLGYPGVQVRQHRRVQLDHAFGLGLRDGRYGLRRSQDFRRG